jgi:hypothetical protein
MIFVDTLHNKHKGQTIWIAGSDPSLSEYPDDFFDDKIAITLHLAHIKFPNATYRYSSEYDRSDYLLKKTSDYRNKALIAAYPMYGNSKQETIDLVGGFPEVYFHRMVSYPPNGIRGEVRRSYTKRKIRQTIKGNARIWGGHGTCLHTALYMAILMGAKEIKLIGAGHGMYKPGMEHFDAVEADHHDMRPGYSSFADPKEHVPLIQQTLLIAEQCRQQGIRFSWYRTWNPEMSDEIHVDETWFKGQRIAGKRKFAIKRRLYWFFIKRPIHKIISLF